MGESEFRKGHIPPANSMERGYLIDASKRKPYQQPKPSVPAPAPLPPIVGELVFPNLTTVRVLARLLKQKPFRIIADLMGLGVFATTDQILTFEAVANVARKYGFIAKRAA
jgi:hypothetical protein